MKTTFLSLVPALALSSICSAATITESFSNTTTHSGGSASPSGTGSATRTYTIAGTNADIRITTTWSSNTATDTIAFDTNNPSGYGISSGANTGVDGSEVLTVDFSYSVINIADGYTYNSDSLALNLDAFLLRGRDNSGNNTGYSYTLSDGTTATGVAGDTWAERVNVTGISGGVDSVALSTTTVNGGMYINGFQVSIDGDLLLDEVVTVPEPSSVALLGLGGLALLSRRKR